MTVHITTPPDTATVAEVWPTLKDFMPRCKDCTHWGPAQPDDDEPPPDYGRCALISQDGLKKTVDDDPMGTGALAAVDTDDRYNGCWLATRSTFGCILWKAKP